MQLQFFFTEIIIPARITVHNSALPFLTTPKISSAGQYSEA